MKKLVVITFSLISFQVSAVPYVVYGDDNRRDVFEETRPELIALAKATAAKVPTIFMRTVGKEVVFRNMSLADRGICASERFSHQSTVSMCSGFLVADNILMTAGHCINSINDCKNFRWVFDYQVISADQYRVTVPVKSVYSCKRVIAQKYDKEPGEDYAVIELDRKVTDRRPMKYRKEGAISPGTPLIVMGNPSGLPTKIADGANVRKLESHWFTANLDTFQGNSGSAVINADTLEVEGILVRGETDYKEDTDLKCQVVNRCENNGCRGEDVNFIPKF